MQALGHLSGADCRAAQVNEHHRTPRQPFSVTPILQVPAVVVLDPSPLASVSTLLRSVQECTLKTRGVELMGCIVDADDVGSVTTMGRLLPVTKARIRHKTDMDRRCPPSTETSRKLVTIIFYASLCFGAIIILVIEYFLGAPNFKVHFWLCINFEFYAIFRVSPVFSQNLASAWC